MMSVLFYDSVFSSLLFGLLKSLDIPFTLVSLEESRSSRSLLVRENVSELVREDRDEEEDLIVHSAIAASIVRLAVIMAITSRGFDYTEDEDCMTGSILLS